MKNEKIKNIMLYCNCCMYSIIYSMWGGADSPDSSKLTIDADGTYENTQPYATQGEDGWELNACGGYAMAYYFAEKGRIPANKVQDTAHKFYDKVKFDSEKIEALLALLNDQGEDDENASLSADSENDNRFVSFSDPVKTKDVMAEYVFNSELRMTTDAKDATDAQALLFMLALFIVPEEEQDNVVKIENLVENLEDNEYVIEIAVSNSPASDDGIITVNMENPFNNNFHYLLTYWKTVNGKKELWTLDSYQGEEKPRSYFDNTNEQSRTDHPNDTYLFCDGGIFITPYNTVIQ